MAERPDRTQQLIEGGAAAAEPGKFSAGSDADRGQIITEEEDFRRLPAVDQLRAPGPRVGPEEAAANRQRNMRDLLSIVPGPGNVIAAEDAVEQGGEMAGAIREGRYGKAAMHGGLGALSAFGAVTGLPTSRMAGNAARGAKDTLPAFPAWHGSPHDFDEFKLDKIGTGEGAQAYGHGLYFAENPTVAREYRDALTTTHPVAGKIKSALDKSGGDEEAALRYLNSKMALEESPAMKQSYQEAIDQFKTQKGAGRLYKAEIDAEPHQLLDWDKPLSEQSAEVRAAVQKASKAHGVAAYADMPATRNYEAQFRDPLEKALPRPFNSRTYAEQALSDNPTFDPIAATREIAPDRLPQVQAIMDQWKAARSAEQATGEKWWKAFVGSGERDPAKATAILREAGIPGIRYLDQGSRGASGGTSNYVIFDDKLVKVLSKE